MTLKRYALFEFEQYYPGGGFNDFVDSFDTPEEAMSYFNLPRPREGRKYDYRAEYAEVVDLQTGQVVAEN